MKKFFRLFLFTIFIVILELRFVPQISAAEYSLTSSDGQVKVVLDSKFGGAITQLYDYANMGNLNLINGYQAGAMFQTAFWTLPYHNYQPPYVDNDPRFPPGCTNKGGDQLSDNPTQAGYVADGKAGNPIGILGTDASAPDSNEFIRYEDNNKTIHFKSRFIRYDYCKNVAALMNDRQWWDTDFYLEQWVSFNSNLPRTLTLRSKIIYIGTGQKSVTSRQLPIIFACNLLRVAYWQRGQKVINFNTTESGINPDTNWAALIASNKEVGIGMVTSNTMLPMLGRGKFVYEELNSSINQCANSGPLSVVFPGGGVPDLRILGTLNNVDYDAPSAHIFTYNPGGSFEWTTYYPIGTLNLIKGVADNLLGGVPFNYVNQISEIHGHVDRVTCDQPDTAGWATDDRNHAQKLAMRLEAYPDGKPNNKIIRTGVTANNIRPDLTGVCPPDGKCAFGITLGTLPSSFANKKIMVNIYGVAPDGENQIETVSNLIGPCNNLITSSLPPSIPGDLDHNGKVDIFDYNLLVGNFGKTGSAGWIPADINSDGKVDIFDYNILVGNFGKTQ